MTDAPLILPPPPPPKEPLTTGLFFCHVCDTLTTEGLVFEGKFFCVSCGPEDLPDDDEEHPDVFDGKEEEELIKMLAACTTGPTSKGARTLEEMWTLPSSKPQKCLRCKKSFVGPYSLDPVDAFCEDCWNDGAVWRASMRAKEKQQREEQREPPSKTKRVILYEKECGCKVYDLEDKLIESCDKHRSSSC